MNSDSGGLEDLSQIAALLKCVETGGASEHVLGQLQMFPEIRGQRGINKRRDVYRKLPRRAKRRVVKGRLERKRWRTGSTVAKAAKSRHLTLPPAPTPPNSFPSLAEFGKETLRSKRASESTAKSSTDLSGSDALSMLETEDEELKRDLPVTTHSASLAEEEKYRKRFFSQVLSVDTSVSALGGSSISSSLYGILRTNGNSSIQDSEDVSYIIPPSRRPAPKNLEKRVLKSLLTASFDSDSEVPEGKGLDFSSQILNKESLEAVSLAQSGPCQITNNIAIVHNSAESRTYSETAPSKLSFLPESLVDPGIFYLRQVSKIPQQSSPEVTNIPTNQDFGGRKTNSLIDGNRSLTERLELVERLGKDQTDARKEKRSLDKTVHNKINKTMETFPLEFLFEVGMKNAYDDRIKKKLKKMLRQWGYRLESQGIHFWKRFVVYHRHYEAIRSATNIQRVYRGHLGRKRSDKIAQARDLRNERKRFKAFMLTRKRWLSAIEIQRHWRGVLGRREYAKALEIMDSVILIQRMWRAKQARVLVIMMRHRNEMREDAASKIEKVFRGHVGRKKAARLRRLKRREMHEKLLEDKEFVIIYSFKKEGAARLLQRWFHNTRVRHVKFLGHMFATRIEALFRGYRGRKLAAKKRFDKFKKKELALFEKTALKLQSRYRTKKAIELRKTLITAKNYHLEELAEKKKAYLEKKAKGSLGLAGRRFGKSLVARVDPFRKKREEAAATKIQKAYRAWLARRLVKRKKYIKSQWARHKKDMCAKVIQKYARGWLARRRVREIRRHRAATKIQAFVRGQRDRTMLRNKMRYDMAIPTIQRYTRGWLARRNVSRVREERRRMAAAIVKCQTMVRMYRSRRKVEWQREFMHRKAEIKKYVVQRFDEALIYEGDRMVLRLGFSNKTKLKILERKVTDPGTTPSAESYRLSEPLRDFFLHFSHPAQSMESMKFLATMKACHGLVEQRTKKKKKKHGHKQFSGINPVEIDLCFAKAIGNAKRIEQEAEARKSKQRATQNKKVVKGISFQGFCDALSMLADIRYSIKNDKGTVIGYSVEKYRKNVGQKARFFKLIDEYVFTDHKKTVGAKYKVKMEKYLQKRASWAASKIQRAARGYWGRNLYAVMKRAVAQEIIDKRKGKKLARLQRRWRKRQAHRKLILLYRDNVKKYIDPVSGLPYWHNPRCNSIRWKKIKWLRRGVDVRTVIELPHPDCEFIQYCLQCNEVSATIYCVDCDDFYCDKDYDSFHAKGKRHLHEKFLVENCIECEYQVATRECHQCGDCYCDTCYWKMHSKGALMQHTFEPLMEMCKICEDQTKPLAVRVSIDDGTKMCNRCYNTYYYVERYQKWDLPLESRSMRIYRDTVLQERKEKEEAALRVKREAAEEHRRLIAAVKRIQGLYRMRKTRRLWYPVILNAHEARIARERREGIASTTKSSLRYRLLSGLGAAPPLEADSSEERIRKLKPMELYEEELQNRYPWLTDEEIEASKFVGERKTGIFKTQQDILRGANLLRAVATGENAEKAKEAAKAAGRVAAKQTLKLVAKGIGAEEGKIGKHLKAKAKDQRANLSIKLAESRADLNGSLSVGLVNIGKTLRDTGVLGGLGSMIVRRGKLANKKAKKLEAIALRKFKVQKLIKERVAERNVMREKEKVWELFPADEENEEYWYNIETGEYAYEDPRTFVDSDDGDIEEEVEEEFSEVESIETSDDDSDEGGIKLVKKKKPTPKDEKNWQITYDEAGTPYYYNDKGETTYEKPDGFVDEETAEYQSGGASDYYEASAGYDDWTEAYDDDGNVYYYNSAGESTYEYPW
jgi:hypothetical protein